MGSQRVRHDWATSLSLWTLTEPPFLQTALMVPENGVKNLLGGVGQCTCLHSCLVTKSCQFFSDPMDYSPPGFSVSSQARILEWVAISCSRGYSWPRDQTQSPVATALPVDSLPLSHQGSLLSIQTVRLRSLGLAHWISSLFCSITKWSWWSSQSSMTNHLHHKTTMIQHSLLSLLLCPGEARTEPALKLIYPCLPDLEITSP